MNPTLFGLWFLHVAIRESIARGSVPLHVFEYTNFAVVGEIERLQLAEIRKRWPSTIAVLREEAPRDTR